MIPKIKAEWIVRRKFCAQKQHQGCSAKNLLLRLLLSPITVASLPEKEFRR
jgi:hypothetical protein